jgi:hypothetical protein
MTSCPFYNDNNLAFTGSKTNNPYALIQNGGKKKHGKSLKKNKKSKKYSKKRRVFRKTRRSRGYIF